MEFIELREKTQLINIFEDSNSLPMGALVFKHSTRCSISRMVLDRFKREWNVPAEKMPVYYLDLIRYRNLSNEISEKFEVVHESPQVLVIKGGRCIYNASHNMISPRLIQAEAIND